MSPPKSVRAYVDPDGKLRCGECCRQSSCQKHINRDDCKACRGTGEISGRTLEEWWPESLNPEGGVVLLVVHPQDITEGM